MGARSRPRVPAKRESKKKSQSLDLDQDKPKQTKGKKQRHLDGVRGVTFAKAVSTGKTTKERQVIFDRMKARGAFRNHPKDETIAKRAINHPIPIVGAMATRDPAKKILEAMGEIFYQERIGKSRDVRLLNELLAKLSKTVYGEKFKKFITPLIEGKIRGLKKSQIKKRLETIYKEVLEDVKLLLTEKELEIIRVSDYAIVDFYLKEFLKSKRLI